MPVSQKKMKRFEKNGNSVDRGGIMKTAIQLHELHGNCNIKLAPLEHEPYQGSKVIL